MTIIVPFAPGGATDIVARLLAEELRARFGQPFIVENRTGAAGNIGVEAVVGQPERIHVAVRDHGQPHHQPAPVHGRQVQRAERDLVPISLTFKVDHILVVNPKVPAKTVAELVAYAKANPDKLTYGSAGVGSSVQMFAVLLEMRTGIKLRHVPYKGSAPALNDVVAGHIDMLMDSVPTSLPQIEAGNTRPLAVTSGTRNKRAAERADDDGSGRSRLRHRSVGIAHGPGRHAAGHRRQAQRGGAGRIQRSRSCRRNSPIAASKPSPPRRNSSPR